MTRTTLIRLSLLFAPAAADAVRAAAPLPPIDGRVRVPVRFALSDQEADPRWVGFRRKRSPLGSVS